jgi:hypothetical protein
MMSEYKKCPYCSEQILADAKKCRYCHSMLEEVSAETVVFPPPPGPAAPSAPGDFPPPPNVDANQSEGVKSAGKTSFPPPTAGATAGDHPASSEKQTVKKKRSKLPYIIGAVLLLIVVLIIVAVNSGRSMLRSSTAYTGVLDYLSANAEAVQYLGEPIELGRNVSGMISTSGSVSEADLEIPVSGALNEGTVYAIATGTGEQWNYSLLELEKTDGSRIDLLQSYTVDIPEGMQLFSDTGYGFTMIYPQTWSY